MHIRSATTCLALLVSSPAFAITADQQDRIDTYWELNGQCTAGIRDAGQCEEMNALHDALLSEGLCFVWGEGDGFFDCDDVAATTSGPGQDDLADVPDVHFSYETVKSVFNMLQPQDRRYIQRKMMEAGYYASDIDGLYGPGTANAMEGMARSIARRQGVVIDMSTPGGIREAIGFMMTYDLNEAG